jgi:hypothetical protein
MEKFCTVCDEPFKDGDKLAVVMLSEFKTIDSDVHFAIRPPEHCLELFHLGCYDNGVDGQAPQDELPEGN